MNPSLKYYLLLVIGMILFSQFGTSASCWDDYAHERECHDDDSCCWCDFGRLGGLENVLNTGCHEKGT